MGFAHNPVGGDYANPPPLAAAPPFEKGASYIGTYGATPFEKGALRFPPPHAGIAPFLKGVAAKAAGGLPPARRAPVRGVSTLRLIDFLFFFAVDDP